MKNKNILDVNFKVIIIQRAVRKFLLKLHREKFRQIYIDQSRKEFFQPLKFDRVNQIKAEIISNLKTMELPNKTTDFQEILNLYFQKYQKFNEEFPSHIKTREDNIGNYYQCMNMLQYMENQSSLDSIFKYESIYTEVNKKKQIRNQLDKILDSIEHKRGWYKYCNIDDYEECNILNEIDSHFNFEKRSYILDKKK